MPYNHKPRRRGFSTTAVRPINVVHAFVNDAAEAGHTHISLSLGLALSGYGIAVSLCPPMAADTSLEFHHAPRDALITSQLRTRCIQSIREVGPSLHPSPWDIVPLLPIHGIIAHAPFPFTTTRGMIVNCIAL